MAKTKKARMPIRRPTFDGKFLRCPKCDVWDFSWFKAGAIECLCGQLIDLTEDDLRKQNGSDEQE